MRTTVTIDNDVAEELKARAKRSGKSFKQILNESLRLAFSVGRSPIRRIKRFRVRPVHSGLRTGIDMDKLNQLADQLEVENRLRSLQRRK